MDSVKKKAHCSDEIIFLIDRFKKMVGAKHNRELAQLLEISDKDFSNRKGKGTLYKLIIDWAIARKMDINSLVYGTGDDSDDRPIQEKAACAQETTLFTHEGIEGCCSFMREMIVRIASNPRNIFMMATTGNSMEPTIYNGEIIMVDTGRTAIYEGGLFVIGINGSSMIKRVSLRPGNRVKVISDNKEYEPYETSREDIQVIAQVIWTSRQLIS